MNGSTSRLRVIVTAAIGNLVEWYDFALYAYSATAISATFFPSGDHTSALLATLAVFGVSFVFRPIGGLVFGRIGDRVGRKNVLSVVVLGMGGCTVAIGLIPSYAAIGLAAPLLLVLMRLGQGFFSGGEYTGASTFLVEYAPANRRGLWAGVSVATGTLPFAFAGFVVLAFASAMPPDAYASWGWRLPFLLSAPFALVGLYLRTRIADTPAFTEVEEQGGKASAPLRTVLARYKLPVLLLFAVASVNAVASYSLTSYMPTHLKENVHLDPTAAAVTNSVVVVLLCLLVPVFGRLSDAVGRKKVLWLGVFGLFVLSVPAYLVLSGGSVVSALLGQVLIMLPFACMAAVVSTVMCELFPTQVRYSGASMGYNIAYAVFGGTAPLVAQFLVVRTDVLIAPGWYLAGLALLLAPLTFLLPETYERGLVWAGSDQARTLGEEVAG